MYFIAFFYYLFREMSPLTGKVASLPSRKAINLSDEYSTIYGDGDPGGMRKNMRQEFLYVTNRYCHVITSSLLSLTFKLKTVHVKNRNNVHRV